MYTFYFVTGSCSYLCFASQTYCIDTSLQSLQTSICLVTVFWYECARLFVMQIEIFVRFFFFNCVDKRAWRSTCGLNTKPFGAKRTLESQRGTSLLIMWLKSTVWSNVLYIRAELKLLFTFCPYYCRLFALGVSDDHARMLRWPECHFFIAILEHFNQ